MSFFSSENTTFISDFLKHFVKHYELFSSDPLNKAIHTQNEKLKYQSKFVNIWREILDNHTFSHRVDSIRRRLHLLPNDKNTLKISIVTPTKRVKNISNVLRNFNQQNYHSKELVIVVNSKYEDYISLKNMLEKYENIQILHMPEDKKAASSLNYAIKHLDGEYFFRFDDDDYYGEEYIADAMRFLKIDDAHIIGKFASYIKIEEKDKVFLRKNSTEEKQLLSFSAKDFTLRDCAMSGATFGVRVALLKQFTFPEESLKTADSSWLELIRKEGEDIRCIKTDFFQFTIGRHIEKNDHTWETELSNLINLNNEVEHNIVEVPR
jgi:glycosyltransferase involved in cell wall biosynthesis